MRLRDSRSFQDPLGLSERLRKCSDLVDDERAQQAQARGSAFRVPPDTIFGRPNGFGDNTKANRDLSSRGVGTSPGNDNFGRLEELHGLRQKRPNFTERQYEATKLSLANRLTDQITTVQNSLQKEATDNILSTKEELEHAFANVLAEDDRQCELLYASHKRIAKTLSETRITDHKLGTQIHIGDNVLAFNELVDTIDGDIVSLWNQWQKAQDEIDNICMELTCLEKAQPKDKLRSESLNLDLGKFEEELDKVLRDAHDKVRRSEKDFGKRMKGVVSTLLQQYFMQ